MTKEEASYYKWQLNKVTDLIDFNNYLFVAYILESLYSGDEEPELFK